MTDSPLYAFNGIDPLTGEYLVPQLPAADVAKVARGERLDKDHLQELKAKAGESEKHFGVKYGVDPKDLAQTGWGAIFAANADPAVCEALQPLLKLRRSQAGPRYREYKGTDAYKGDMSSLDFLSEHDAGPGPANPDKVPYYLLIVGDPEAIPYEFQYQLDVQYGVGRVAFGTAEEYANYARSVVLAEQADGSRRHQVVFFGTANTGDYATQLSAEQLIAPLADGLAATQAGWRVDKYVGEHATKSRLAGVLTEQAGPGLLFTATHGLGLPNGHPLQPPLNGALLCQDWPGSGPAKADHYFAAADLAKDANLLGLISFHFACFAAGTPKVADFPDKNTGQRGPIAPASIVSKLPQQMLSQPNGGSLAVVGHIDRGFACSFRWDGAQSPQLEVFQSAVRQLMDGFPVGAAMEFFNMRYAELSTLLTQRLDDIRMKFKAVDDRVMAALWLSVNDARNFVVVGDPAVRLKLASAPPAQ